jgi:hypothetical protein
MTIPASNLWQYDPSSRSLKIRFSDDAQISQIVYRSHKERGGYLSFAIDLPKRPRSTGEKSQNHRINGFIQQIAESTGQDFDSIKLYCKSDAVARGYPHDTIKGVMIPWSETRIDTIQAGYLIDSIEQLAAEMGIVLKE